PAGKTGRNPGGVENDSTEDSALLLVIEFFNGKQDQVLLIAAQSQAAGLQFHGLAANVLEGVLDFKVLEAAVMRKNFFQQRAQAGDVPLAVTQFVNAAIECFFGIDLKVTVKSLVGALDTQSLIEQQHGPAHGVDERVGKRAALSELFGAGLDQVNIDHRQDRAIDFVIGGFVRADADGIPPVVPALDLQFLGGQMVDHLHHQFGQIGDVQVQ